MCSRFDLNSDIRAFQVQLGLNMEDIRRMAMQDENRTANANDQVGDDVSDDLDAAFEGLTGTRRPTDPIAVILPGQKVAIRSWGLTVPGLNSPMINARAETLREKPTFRPLLERRCLIPATGWYEWRKNGTAKHKNRITLPDHQPFLFAGLENGREATIITCAPSPAIAHIHNRMPAIIGPNHIAPWLDPMIGFEDLGHMLGPLPDHILAWHEETPGTQTSGPDRNQIDLFSK
ncbi:SOS response-associated peptidase [Thalassospira povalilytica]|uniref:SOS response-associated peptidase n=1 Tax=Thalassospira povalilytica TaxID=732237 RepID=UPI001D19575E|nr:SOS response-associated peptidase [Thalassospira povalilytica]MCC4241404.1 SOS response-associated peptidase [Thalassospira povalilytica]